MNQHDRLTRTINPANYSRDIYEDYCVRGASFNYLSRKLKLNINRVRQHIEANYPEMVELFKKNGARRRYGSGGCSNASI